MARLSRRQFMGRGAVLGGSALLLGPVRAFGQTGGGHVGSIFGDLVPDPGGLLDLPKGFQYRILSEAGSLLTNGAPVPGDHDGMAAFAGKGNTTILIRNHELRDGEGPPVPGRNPYNPSEPGGTTGIVVGPDRRAISDFVTSSGTRNNCAGGATPWGTWLTCEEDRTTGHGYVFEVVPDEPENDLSRTPIHAMGFFSHEAVDIDPRTGIAYLTEDDFRGSIPPDPNAEVVADLTTSEGGSGTRVSYLYRYLPNDRSGRPGSLLAGGRLQVLTLQNLPNHNLDLAQPRDRFGVVWADVNPVEPHEDAEEKGGARFNRLEGCHFAGGAFWFDDTAGGERRLGQIFRLIPGPEDVAAADVLELFYEGTEVNQMESPDNIIITPWGDLWFAEDGAGENRVMGITPDGRVYKFASNRLNDSEFAGPCFSPDGQTFFVNIQNPGYTFAIWGPFARRNAGGARAMAAAAPPRELGPQISGELAAEAERLGLSPLEAAAYDRLGVLS